MNLTFILIHIWMFLQNTFGLSLFTVDLIDMRPQLSRLGVLMIFPAFAIYSGAVVWNFIESQKRIDIITVFGTDVAKLGTLIFNFMDALVAFTNFLPVLILFRQRRQLLESLLNASMVLNKICKSVGAQGRIGILSCVIRIILAVTNITMLVWYTVGSIVQLGKFNLVTWSFYVRIVIKYIFKFLIIFDLMLCLAVIEKMFNSIRRCLRPERPSFLK